jgi:hypothetical protein
MGAVSMGNRKVFLLLACALWLSARGARAQDGTPSAPLDVGDGAWALPGVSRVAFPAVAEPRVAAALSLGYGFIEAQSSSDGLHHRLPARLALGVIPLRGLELAWRSDARYDKHPEDEQGSDDGTVLDQRLLARAATKLGTGQLGLELNLLFPGADGVSDSFKATTGEAKAVAAAVARPVSFGGYAGFRYDRTSEAGKKAERLRSGDRLALGLSDYNAVLLGAGMVGSLGKTELLAEISADLLIGSDAPSLTESPLRALAGVRQQLSRSLAFEAMVEGSLSQRPALEPESPLIPIEPRLAVLIGLRYRFGGAPPTGAIKKVPKDTPERKPEPATVKLVPVALAVVDASGEPVNDVELSARVGERTIEFTLTDAGQFEAAEVPEGTLIVSARAPRFEPSETSVSVVAGAPVKATVALTELPPAGQIRGLVRSFGGQAVRATVHVEPGGQSVETDAEGVFQLDVAPGSYEVTIRAPGYRQQVRKIQVEKTGVTVLNADLVQGR